MRLLAVVSLLFLIAALVLNVLLLLAGNQTSFLENIDIVTFNVSEVADQLLTSPNSPLVTGLEAQINANPQVSAIASVVADVLGPSGSAAAENVIGRVGNGFAQDAGLKNYYSFHVQNWCGGYYEPNAIASNATKNTTECATREELWNDNLTQIIESQLNPSYDFVIPFINEKIPSGVNEGLEVVRLIFKIMFIFYCVVIGVTGLGIILGVFALFLDGRISACLSGIWAFLDLLCSIVASGIATAIMLVSESVTRQYYDQIGITTYRGNGFLAMTWVSTACLFVAFLTWAIDCCVGGSRRKNRRSKEQYQYQ